MTLGRVAPASADALFGSARPALAAPAPSSRWSRFDPAPTWNPLSGVLADYQFTQFSLYRLCVIFVILTEAE